MTDIVLIRTKQKITKRLCLFVNKLWATQFTVCETVSYKHCEIPTVLFRPHYLPREFGHITVIVILAYAPGPHNTLAPERITAVTKPYPGQRTTAVTKPYPGQRITAVTKPYPGQRITAVTKPYPGQRITAVTKPYPGQRITAITKRYPGQRTSLCWCVVVSTRATLGLLIFFLTCISTSPVPRASTKHWTCAMATSQAATRTVRP